MTTPDEKERLKSLRALSELLDSKFEGPFGIRIGLDGILGFVPVVGDVVTTLVSFSLLIAAARLGATPSTLVRMSMNILFENIVDLIPFFGSVFDIFWKSNLRNLRILEAQLESPARTSVASRWVVTGIILVLSVVLFLLAYLGVMIVQFFVGLLS